jgi:protein-disulfide isomerase
MRARTAVVAAIVAHAGATAATARADADPGADRPTLAPRANIRRVEHRPLGDVPTMGPTAAPVTIDLFFVPGQQRSRVPFDQFRALQARHPSRIRLVFRIVADTGLLAAEAAAEAHAQGKFVEFVTAQNRQPNQQHRDGLLQLARDVGLDVARLEAAWKDGRHEAMMKANEQRRMRLHVKQSMPSAVINGVVIGGPLQSLGEDAIEGLYAAAYDRGIDLLDRGVPRDHLAEAFDRVAMAARGEHKLKPGAIDDPDPDEPLDAPPALLAYPLEAAAWPSTGPAGAAVTIVVLCNLRTVACQTQLVDRALKIRDLFPDDVRLVWGPMFDPAASDAADLTLLNDAALCAEELGAGWAWVDQATQLTKRRKGRPGEADREIDDLIELTKVDGAAMASCLASGAGASARAVARNRGAGVRSGPSIVVGGRVYPGGVSDARSLQALVEDELAPGLLEDLAPDWDAGAAGER